MQDNDVPYSSYSIDIFGAIGDLFRGGFEGDAFDGFSMFDTLIGYLIGLWNVYSALALLASAALLFGIIYAYMRTHELEEAESNFIAEAERAYRSLYGEEVKNQRWKDVLSHIASDEPNAWKLAIIEADIILGEALNAKGFAGNTIGDQLKSASPRNMATLQSAWEAHKIRNQIAHSGTDFVLTKKIAQETITQYKMVFEELGAI